MGARKQVRLGGLGGQGVVLAGMLLGAAGVFEGKFAAGSNSYGAQARGSECKSEIILSDEPIDYPRLLGADILVAYAQPAYDAFAADVIGPDGRIFYDSSLITCIANPVVRQVGVAATDVALKELKNKQFANIILLGTVVELSGIVSPHALRKAIRTHVGEPFRAPNLLAFQIGIRLGRENRG